MPNLIYRGPIGAVPYTTNLPIDSAALPGVAVTSDGATLSVASDASAEVYLLGTNTFTGQGAEEAYESGDTATAFALASGGLFSARMAAGTYAMGQALSVGAGGMLTDAGTDRVVAFYRGVAGTVADEALADVVVA